MYIKKSKRKNDRLYLSIVHGYRDKNKKSCCKTIKSLGYLDDLEKLYDDPIAHFEQEIVQMEALEAEKTRKVTFEMSLDEKIDKRTEQKIHIGAAAVLQYLHYMGIDKFFDNKRSARNCDYDPCRILELLITNRISNPTSKKAAWDKRESFPRKCNFELADVYRSLDYFDHYTKELIKYVNDSIERKWGARDLNNVYYDVTNYYFECDPDDEEGLRQKGVSKEHRPNPIVQMGLMIDSNGIPMSYDIFPGNTNDCLTMMPVIKNIKHERELERVVVVADKGLNTSDNIAACLLDGNGYIFSQSVRKADSSLQSWVLDDTDYDKRDGFKVKSKCADKIITIRDKQGKIIGKETVPVRLVAFWSEDYAKRSAALRKTAITKAQKMVSTRASYEHAKHVGAAKYVKETFVDIETGEIPKSLIQLDEKAIEQEAKFDGYYCLVTSEEDKTPEEIIEIYRGLWKIEESFRIMKSDFDARPVFVSTKTHIKAHFLICYLSLVAMRLMQRDLQGKHSAKEIAQTIAEMQGVHLEENYYLFSYRTDLSDKLSKTCKMNLSNRLYSKKDIANIVAGIKKS